MKLDKLMTRIYLCQDVRIIDGFADTIVYEGKVASYFLNGYGSKYGKCVVCAISTEGEKIIIRLKGANNEQKRTD